MMTAGTWNWACDSYGKVQHSQKYDCVFSTFKRNGATHIKTIAARIENPHDAMLLACAKRMYETLQRNLEHLPEAERVKAESLLSHADGRENDAEFFWSDEPCA